MDIMNFYEKLLQGKIIQLLSYIEQNRYESFDYVDFWSTNWGQSIKQLTYKTEPFGYIFILPIMASELWLPYLRRILGIKKKISPIVIAHHGLTCIEVFKNIGKEKYLILAREDCKRLIDIAIPNQKGLCWGFPFALSTNSGLIPPNLPAATQTAYAFDLFKQLWLITGEEKYYNCLTSIAEAIDKDYINLPRSFNIASTYFAHNYGDIVFNAISYRIYILTGALGIGAGNYLETIHGLTSYLISQQKEDGSWFYGEKKANHFVDHFHTAFIIKNLMRANSVLSLKEITISLDRAINFYWINFFDKFALPKPYSTTVRFNIVRYESYDFAECLGLFALLGPNYGFSRIKLEHILNNFINKFWLSEGAVRFRKYIFPTPKGYPYYRFGMSAAMLSFAQLLNSPVICGDQ
jgi:hypothetical protein